MSYTDQADPYGRGSYCIVVALHGTDSREAEVLRDFRDTYLQKVPGGQSLIDIYYWASPRILRRVSRSSPASKSLSVIIRGFSGVLGLLI